MKKEIDIKIPTIPNFINGMSIGEFTDEELQEIGEEWTKKLIEKAERKRIPF